MKAGPMQLRVVADVSALPTYAFGPRLPLWWGTLGYIVIEGLGFVFAIAAAIYLEAQNGSWPLTPPAGLTWSTALTAIFVLSEVPNWWTKRRAHSLDLRSMRIGVLVMSLVGLGTLGIRAAEFTTVGVRWDDNAYGSIVWILLGLHTAHLITDVVETWVMAAMLFIGPIDLRRFSDIEDNQNYWDFVVVAWLPVYFVIYWLPRL
jgi:cytochrome c oxidase subunit 3